MDEIITLLNKIELTKNIIAAIKIFIPAIAWVYLFGRMLNITKKDTAKNLVAFIAIILSMFLYAFFPNYYDWYLLGSLSVILYVLVGFNLYSRVDSFFDKFGKNKDRKRK